MKLFSFQAGRWHAKILQAFFGLLALDHINEKHKKKNTWEKNLTRRGENPLEENHSTIGQRNK